MGWTIRPSSQNLPPRSRDLPGLPRAQEGGAAGSSSPGSDAAQAPPPALSERSGQLEDCSSVPSTRVQWSQRFSGLWPLARLGERRGLGGS